MTTETNTGVSGALEPVDETVGPVVSTAVQVLTEASSALSERYPQWANVLFTFAQVLNDSLPD